MKKVPVVALAFLLTLSFAPSASAAAPVLAAHGLHGSHGRIRIGVGFGFGYWPGYSYGPYAPYGRSYGYGSRYGGEYGGRWGVIDTDVSPEEARVYLDGKYLGSADDFDGMPGYLYLRPGRYRLEFRLDGYETQSVEVRARAGQALDLTNHLKKVPGASRYGSYDTPVPEGGIRRFWGKRHDKTEPYGGEDRDARYRGREGRSDRDRMDRERDERDRNRPEYRDERDGRSDDRRWQDDDGEESAPDADADDARAFESEAPAGPDSDSRPDEPSDVHSDQSRSDQSRSDQSRSDQSHSDQSIVRPDVRDGKTRLRLKIEPRDAAVYLDDRFIGTGEEVGSLSSGVSVRPGKHRVTVSRPGMRDRSVDVEVGAGKSESLEIKLEK